MSMEPPVCAPVGTRTGGCPTGHDDGVISTISACGASTDSRVIVALTPQNVKVAPAATNPAIAYATRKVALPEMRAPTDPPIDADARVALPLNDTGPEMDSEPDVPALSTLVEM